MRVITLYHTKRFDAIGLCDRGLTIWLLFLLRDVHLKIVSRKRQLQLQSGVHKRKCNVQSL